MTDLPSKNDLAAVLRLLDAATNRAGEGLRAVEDYTRFILDDAHLTRLLKEMRHDLTDALASLPWEDRLAARDTQADVGTPLSTANEQSRESMAEVATANLVRVQQALRSLEETGKVISPEVAGRVKQLRYRSYTIQKAIATTSTMTRRLEDARLYVLTDGCVDEASFAVLIQRLVDAGVGVIQLRDKQLDDRTLMARAKLLRQLTRGSGALFIMNDRPDLAMLADADGVHVGQEELSVKEVRSIVGTRILVGVSTHTIEQARAAVLDGANYLGVGPVFASTTKEFDDFPGLEFVRQAAAEITLPWFAIGGIDQDNVAQVIKAGARRVACGAAICDSPDLASSVAKFAESLTTTCRLA